MSNSVIIPLERIQSRIVVLRGQRVLLDADLAELYGVPTRQLNQAVKRNLAKFPEDFMFRLIPEESGKVFSLNSPNVTPSDNRSQTVIGSAKHRVSKALPYAFTEHGAIQAANVLRSEAAVEMSVQVVRAFVRLRQLVVNHKAISRKLSELESRIGEHDEQLAAIVEALRQLSEPVLPEKRRRIGFDAS